jgi:uncharacterized protein YjbI with pentapeptide repeats
MKRPISLIAASLIAFGGISGAQAYDKEQLEAVKSGQKECPGCDLSNAELNDLDLTKVNLAGVNLSKAWCNWTTKLPTGSGWTCDGAVFTRK